jgi:hypothetical protein
MQTPLKPYWHYNRPVLLWPAKKLAYRPIPKAACSSIRWALRELQGLPLPDPWWKIHELPYPYVCELGEAWNQNYDVFTVIRNPWDRLWSLYRSKWHPDRIKGLQEDHPEISLKWTFEDFAIWVAHQSDSKCNEHIASQTSLLQWSAYPNRIFLMRFESLFEDWLRFQGAYPKLYKVSFPALPKLNESRTNHSWWDAYNHKLAKIVGERYEEDCCNFNYSFPE